MAKTSKTKTSKTKTSRPFPALATDVTEFPLQVRRAARVAFRKGEAASESPRGDRFPSVSDARMFPSRTETEKADDASSARDAYERMLAAEQADRAAIMSGSRRREETLFARQAPREEREQQRLAEEIALYGEERVVDSAKKAEDIAKRVDDQRSARRFARRGELLTEIQTRGLDKPHSALVVDSVLDRIEARAATPLDPGERKSPGEKARTEYARTVKARAAQVKSGKMSFAEARRPVNPLDFEARDTSQFAAARKAAAAAERADFVFKEPEEEMYVPRGPEAYGAAKSVDISRFKPAPSAEALAAKQVAREAMRVIDSSGELDAVIAERLRVLRDSPRDAAKISDFAKRIRKVIAQSRGQDPSDEPLTDSELLDAMLRVAPARKATAGRFTAAMRGKDDTDEQGEVLFEGIASRYAMDPKLSGALVSAYKRVTRAKPDLNLRRLAAEAEVEFLVPQLTGARKSFNAKVREWSGLTSKQRKKSGRANHLRSEILQLARDFGFTLPTNV